MRAPTFAAEFSIYASNSSYRVSGGQQPADRSVIVPQTISCEEYECVGGSPRDNVPASYCIRCHNNRLQ